MVFNKVEANPDIKIVKRNKNFTIYEHPDSERFKYSLAFNPWPYSQWQYQQVINYVKKFDLHTQKEIIDHHWYTNCLDDLIKLANWIELLT